jgi:hypothetical protein
VPQRDVPENDADICGVEDAERAITPAQQTEAEGRRDQHECPCHAALIFGLDTVVRR